MIRESMLGFSRISIKSKLMLMLLSVSLGSIVIVGCLSWSMAKVTIRNRTLSQLTSDRATKAYQIESYFRNLRNYMTTLSEDKMVLEAMVELNQGFQEVDRQLLPGEWIRAIAKYYQSDFLPKLAQIKTENPDWNKYLPNSRAANYLQYQYIVQNPYPTGKKDQLDAAGDRSIYTQYHRKYHQLFRNLVTKFGYDDLFLIDYQTGNIVYSVAKKPDFATNLNDGIYRRSNLAKVVKKVRENADRGLAEIVDFATYDPSSMQPAAFIAAPIYQDSQIVGIVAIQLPTTEINQILIASKNEQEQEQGLHNSSETYVVGSDLLMRSLSQFFVDDQDQYYQFLIKNHVSENTINLMKQLQTTVLLQKVNTEAVKDAIAENTGTNIIKDYRGIKVLSSYSPLSIEGLNWVILSEMDLAEADQPLYQLQNYLLITTIILILIITYLANFTASNFTKPIKTIIQSSNTEDIIVTSQDELSDLAQLVNNIRHQLKDQTLLIEQQQQENQNLLLNLMPTSVAKRFSKGEKDITDQVQQVSLMFATLVGINSLNHHLNHPQVNHLFNELITNLDDKAGKHEVERLKLFGEFYLAVCGLTKPRLDHAKRLVDFALDAIAVIDDFNNTHGTKISLKIGLHTGSLMTGIIGGDKFVYNVWGDTVTIANQLMNQADLNTIMVTDTLHQRLHDAYDFEQSQDVNCGDKGLFKTWVLRKKWLKDLINDLTLDLDFDNFNS